MLHCWNGTSYIVSVRMRTLCTQVESLGDALGGRGARRSHCVGLVFDEIRERGLISFACFVPIRRLRSASCVVPILRARLCCTHLGLQALASRLREWLESWLALVHEKLLLELYVNNPPAKQGSKKRTRRQRKPPHHCKKPLHASPNQPSPHVKANTVEWASQIVEEMIDTAVYRCRSCMCLISAVVKVAIADPSGWTHVTKAPNRGGRRSEDSSPRYTHHATASTDPSPEHISARVPIEGLHAHSRPMTGAVT